MTTVKTSLKEKFAIAILASSMTTNILGYVALVKPVQGAPANDRAQLAELSGAIATFPPIKGMR